jgi:hypothetical protein
MTDPEARIAWLKIVQSAEFESANPAFAGVMRMTATLTAIPGGIAVAILCENVPEGIKPDNLGAGLSSTRLFGKRAVSGIRRGSLSASRQRSRPRDRKLTTLTMSV